MSSPFSLQHFPPHLRELASPILSFLNSSAESSSISGSADQHHLLTGLMSIMTNQLATSSQEAAPHPNVLVLIGRIAQELDYPATINDFFRTNDDNPWLSPFIADWHHSQDKLQEARAILDAHFERIKQQVEAISEWKETEAGKIQAYLEAFRVRALLQLQNPDRSEFSLTLRKAMTFLEKLKEKSTEHADTWSSYFVRFSAIQLMSELTKPDLDIVEAIERNVADIISSTEDAFSSLLFLKVLIKGFASLKQHHQLEQALNQAWELIKKCPSKRLAEELTLTFSWFSLLRLDANSYLEALTTLYQLIKDSREQSPEASRVLLKLRALVGMLPLKSSAQVSREMNESMTTTASTQPINAFYDLHWKVHAKMISSDEFTAALREYLEKARTHGNAWLESCLSLLELRWYLVNNNIGLFLERLANLQQSDTWAKMEQHEFFKLQMAVYRAVTDLFLFWSPMQDFDTRRIADSLQQLTTYLNRTALPELTALAIQLKTFGSIINHQYQQIFTLSREIKSFNKDLLRKPERIKHDFFIAQVEWIEREIAMNEQLSIPALAEPPAPDSPEALRTLFFDDDRKITASLLGMLAEKMQQLFTLDFTVLSPGSLAFDVVTSLFSE